MSHKASECEGTSLSIILFDSVAAKLIAFTSEEVTLNSLKLVGMVLHHSPTK